MLTLENQYQIDDLLRQENLLTNEDLLAELTDHYSVALEERLAQGQDAEMALLAINADFGGRKGLQQLERKYNRVTFRRYDRMWWEIARELYKSVSGWFSLALTTFICYPILNSPDPNPWTNHGFIFGIVGGVMLGLQRPLWIYLKNLVLKGFHNPPAEVQYLLSRVMPATIIFWGIGFLMNYLAPLWPWLNHQVTCTTYMLSMFIVMQTYGKVYERLYKTDDFRWT
jgi:hypothetical protein